MQNQLFKQIGPNARKNWPFVGEVVCVQLMGDGIFPVPFLKEASYYDLGSVIVKEALSPLEKLRRRVPGAMAIGRLCDFVRQKDSTFQIKDLKPVPEEKSTLNQNYVFSESNMRNGLKKSITVEVIGCYKQAYPSLPEVSSLTVDLLDKGFHHLTKFYLIHTVYYAKSVRIEVTVGDKTDQYQVNEAIPLGFKLRKYHFGPEGKLTKYKDISDPNWTVTWIEKSKIRTPMDRLPNIPVDHEGQSEDDGYVTLPGARAGTRDS
ncbi:uncharacterized protein LOC110465423 [Mizuhopecten yessoensis]|uniref:Uncharacterized protein n=1 Tax=Mizuhopecten yessoensis TaxID=6573 RepID=A0A210R1Q1_MIZYE|nr:uncharacterized protein LOC110465423 [Mizuhopecten yessoensis]OWF54993.1 hypothetical protein KP79_PYT12935 [Mizuhopecten yessoensis]